MDHNIAYPDIDGEDPNSAPAWLKVIDVVDGVLTLSPEQTEIIKNNEPSDYDPAPRAQKKYDAGVDIFREFLYQKSLADSTNDAAVKLKFSDARNSQLAEDVGDFLDAAGILAGGKTFSEWLASARPKAAARISARKSARAKL